MIAHLIKEIKEHSDARGEEVTLYLKKPTTGISVKAFNISSEYIDKFKIDNAGISFVCYLNHKGDDEDDYKEVLVHVPFGYIDRVDASGVVLLNNQSKKKPIFKVVDY